MKLSDICIIQAGGTPARSRKEYWDNGDIPWVKISDFSGKYLTETDEKITSLGLSCSSAKVFPKGTLLYTIFATLGEVCVLNIDATTNQAIAGITINSPLVNRDYLYYYLVAQKEYVNKIGRGVAQNNINMAILRNFEIPLPKLEKQVEIAKILAKIDQLIEQRQMQLSMIEELVKSRFIEMFGNQRTNPFGWEMVTIGDIATEVRYGTSRPAVEGGKYPYLRMNNLTYEGYLDLTDLKYIDIPDNEIEKCVVRNGDVLFNRTNSVELVGKTCVYNLNCDMIIAGYIIRVRIDERMLPVVLSNYLNSTVNLDDRQIYFVNQIINYIVKNGMLVDLKVLQEAPFTDKGDVADVFTDAMVWLDIMKVIKAINANAYAA